MNPQKKSLEIIGKESGVRFCGHQDDFKLLKGEKPEYTVRRKEKWILKRCAACVAAADKKSKEEAAKRRQLEGKFRLPHGSVLHATYDVSAEKWHGTLTAGTAVLEADCPGVHGLMRSLGLRWKLSQPATAAAAPSTAPATLPLPDDELALNTPPPRQQVQRCKHGMRVGNCGICK